MCLRNVQKIGASGLNGCQDINLPTPNVFAQLGPALATGTLPAGMLIPHSGLEMFLCVSGNLQTKFGAWGLNGCQDIDLPTLHMYLFNLAWLVATSALYLCRCVNTSSGLEMFLCVSGTSKEHLVHEDPNRS